MKTKEKRRSFNKKMILYAQLHHEKKLSRKISAEPDKQAPKKYKKFELAYANSLTTKSPKNQDPTRITRSYA